MRNPLCPVIVDMLALFAEYEASHAGPGTRPLFFIRIGYSFILLIRE
jgi:hypothetical protein